MLHDILQLQCGKTNPVIQLNEFTQRESCEVIDRSDRSQLGIFLFEVHDG